MCNINSAYFIHIMPKIRGGQGPLCPPPPPPPPPPPGSYAYAQGSNSGKNVAHSSRTASLETILKAFLMSTVSTTKSSSIQCSSMHPLRAWATFSAPAQQPHPVAGVEKTQLPCPSPRHTCISCQSPYCLPHSYGPDVRWAAHQSNQTASCQKI